MKATLITLGMVLIVAVGILTIKKHYFFQPLYLVKADYSGGMCPNGPCSSSRVIYKSNNSDLQELINQTDFNEIRKVKFTELCPTAYDGSKVLYTFYTSHGIEQIDTCVTKVNPNSPLFQTTQERLH